MPSFVILGTDGVEGVSDGIERVRKASSDALIIYFGLYPDLALASAALRAGARGFIHAGMEPDQITRALTVAGEGHLVAPRQLLEYLLTDEDLSYLDALSERQREILELVGQGLTNARIAKRLFLTESTVKQHLRTAYRLLGVSNRTEAARLIRKKR